MPAQPLTSDVDTPALPGVTPATACTGCGTVTPDALLWTLFSDPDLACCAACAAAHPVFARVIAGDLL